MGLGKDVYEEEGVAPTILKKVYILYDRYVGPDFVFPVSNGAPRIMTKFKDQPYIHMNYNRNMPVARRNFHA
jgi:hypothetical protein